MNIIVLLFGDSGRNGLPSSVPRYFGSVVGTSVYHFADDFKGAAGLIENVVTASGHVTGAGH